MEWDEKLHMSRPESFRQRKDKLKSMTKKDPLVRRKLRKNRFLYMQKHRDRKQVIEHELNIQSAENTSNYTIEHQQSYSDWIIIDKQVMDGPSKTSFLTTIMRLFGFAKSKIENSNRAANNPDN